jgi:hypothetical protein
MGAPSGQIPSFWDRAIGGGFGGTATPLGSVVSTADLISGGVIFEEDADSPQLEFAEQGTIRHSFRCDTANGFFLAQGLKRGTILEDSTGHFSRVLSTSVNWQKGNFVQLVVVAESLMTGDVPPDEFNIDPIEFSPSIEKHPRYFIYDPNNPGPVVSGPGTVTPYVIMTPFDIFLCKNQIQGSDFFTQQTFETLVGMIPNLNDPYGSQATAANRSAAAAELVQKMLLGIESPYIPAFRVTFAKYFFYGAIALGGANVNPNLNPGGFIQDPTDIIPPQYWSVTGTGALNTNILVPFVLGGAMDTTLCPTFYDRGISWLREADSIIFQRTWFKITSVWTGGPIGQFDPDIYSRFPSPYLP